MAEAHLQKDFDFSFSSEPRVFHEGQSSTKGKRPIPTFDSETRGQLNLHCNSRTPEQGPFEISGGSSSDYCMQTVAKYNQNQHTAVSQNPWDNPHLTCKLLPTIETSIQQQQQQQQQHHHTRVASKRGFPAGKRRWRKISEVFRAGVEEVEPISANIAQHLNAEEKKLGLPISRTIWRNPKSPLEIQDDFTAECTTPQNPTSTGYNNSHVGSLQSFAIESPALQQKEAHPQLEVEIPLTPLERFSVMFRGIHGGLGPDPFPADMKVGVAAQSPGARNEQVTGMDVSALKRRATSPTASHFETSAFNTASQPRPCSKYSLFPTTPISVKPSSTTSSPVQSRRRSVTAPTEVLLLKVKPASDIVKVVNHSQESLQYMSHSLQMNPPVSNQVEPQIDEKLPRVTSDNEIFFDIQSFRDSKGIESTLFEMTRPPSAVVQIARSQSKARKIGRKHFVPKTLQGYDGDGGPEVHGPVSVTSAQIDDAIAMVESLTATPATTALSLKTAESLEQNSQDTTISSIKECPEKEPEINVHQIDCTRNDKGQRIPHTVTSGINIAQPLHTESRGVAAHLANSAASAASTSVDLSGMTKSKNDQSRASTDESPSHSSPANATTMCSHINLNSPTEGVRKNPTHVPLSKYAPRQITEELIGRPAIRPVHSRRANTENAINYKSPNTECQRSCHSKRSSSLPTMLAHVPKLSQASEHLRAGPQVSSDATVKIPTTVAYIRPAAEVSIARKVSLIHKQSAKIVEPRSGAKVQVSSLPKGLERTTSIQESRQVERKRLAEVVKRMPIVQETNKHKPSYSVYPAVDSPRRGLSDSKTGDIHISYTCRIEKALPPIPVS